MQSKNSQKIIYKEKWCSNLKHEAILLKGFIIGWVC